MHRTTHVRRSLAATGAAAALVTWGALAAAPGATAAPALGQGATTLSVDGPASVGFAGQPVEFSETVGNTGKTPEDLRLVLDAFTGEGVMADALSVDYLTSSGSWQPVPLDFAKGDFSGIAPFTFTLAPKTTRTIRLRIGLPMGRPHDGDSNGGTDSIKLTSTVAAMDGSWVAQARDTRTIKVTSITSQLVGAPATAVVGGKPVEFDVVLADKTPSDYVNLGHVLFTDRHTTVQVSGAGGWKTLTPVLPNDAPDRAGYYLGGRDSSATAGSSTTTRVRISWDAHAPLGAATLSTCVFVNEGKTPFQGTTMCSANVSLTLVSAQSGQPSPSTSSSPSSTATPTATSSASSSPSPSSTGAAPVGGTSAAPTPSPSPSGSVPADTAGTQLAETGGGVSRVEIVTAIALLLAGAAAAAFARFRRRA